MWRTTGPRVLVVEEDAVTRSAVATSLRGGGAQVLSAASWGEAVSLLRRIDPLPELIIGGVMPGIGAEALLSSASPSEPPAWIPIVSVIGFPVPSGRRGALRGAAYLAVHGRRESPRLPPSSRRSPRRR